MKSYVIITSLTVARLFTKCYTSAKSLATLLILMIHNYCCCFFCCFLCVVFFQFAHRQGGETN